jgi:hypothetical protein
MTQEDIQVGEVTRIEDWNLVESPDSDCTAAKMSSFTLYSR